MPLYALLISSVLNILLDLIFVVVFQLGCCRRCVGYNNRPYCFRPHSGMETSYRSLRRQKSISDVLQLIRISLSIYSDWVMPSASSKRCLSAGMLVTQRFSNMFGSDFIAANAIK